MTESPQVDREPRFELPTIGEPVDPQEVEALMTLGEYAMSGGRTRAAMRIYEYTVRLINGDETSEGNLYLINVSKEARGNALEAWRKTPPEQRPRTVPSVVLFEAMEQRPAGRPTS